MTDDERTEDTQYGFFTTDEGETVVYDRDNPNAWIQSTFAVELGPRDETETTA